MRFMRSKQVSYHVISVIQLLETWPKYAKVFFLCNVTRYRKTRKQRTIPLIKSLQEAAAALKAAGQTVSLKLNAKTLFCS